MCVGLPMQIVAVAGTRALARGRGEQRWVDLRLVGPCAEHDWLLVFNGAARERLDAARAREIDRALDLLADALAGRECGDADPGFALPSALGADDLAALAGLTRAPHPGEQR